ncbi:MAG: YcxB family protein [Ruminococcaceae bacterium]|nr:YcxB family protein [Oscillospiraceae bacterium]
MAIQSTTVYTKERLLRFNDYIVLTKRALHWVPLLVASLVVFASAFLGGFSDFLSLCALIAVVCDVAVLFAYLILPRITVGKAKSLNSICRFTFEENQLILTTQNDQMEDTSTFRYSFFTAADKNGDVLYLFISRYQGFIVDLSGLSPEEQSNLRTLLSQKFPQKQLKWKD